MAATQVFVADLGVPALTDEDDHHLQRVLRLRDGEEVVAADGRGGWCPCAFAAGSLRPVGPVVHEPRRLPLVTVAFAPTKGDRPEWTVQKLTELGVDTIVPLQTARSVVRWGGDRAVRQLGRLHDVAAQAGRQSRRLWLPVIAPVTAFSTMVTEPDTLVLAEPGGDPPTLDRPTVMIGPEGGWSDDELAAAVPTVGLGPEVLRAETAALAAAALLVALRAGLVGRRT